MSGCHIAHIKLAYKWLLVVNLVAVYNAALFVAISWFHSLLLDISSQLTHKQMENHTANTTTSSNPPYLWIGEPKQRTTFGIFSFCFSTLIICVWSTLHFPIPTRRYTATRRVFFKVSWMVFALLAPEVLLYLAVNERIKAGALLKRVLKLQPDLAKPGMFARMYSSSPGYVPPYEIIL